MARKRLSFSGFEAAPQDPFEVAPETKSAHAAPPPASGMAPIARVAGEASALSALEDLSRAVTEAREGGRMVQEVPLTAIDPDWLVRDRLHADPEELEVLKASLAARGQQVPLELVALENGRFGLISGWRRLLALKALHHETGEARFATALALLRKPESAGEAYLAMIEENEIRAGLSYYERARVVARAAEAGAFESPRAALSALFAAASKARRSKIGSFLVLQGALDGVLRFPAHISERLGLALVKAIEADPGFAARLGEALRQAQPQSAEAELALLAASLNAPKAGLKTGLKSGAKTAAEALPPGVTREEVRPGIWLETEGGFSRLRLSLDGKKVDGSFRARLLDWLNGKG